MDAKTAIGAAPGIEYDELIRLRSKQGAVHLTCIDYSPVDFQVQEIDNIGDFLKLHRPKWSVVRWINLAGLNDMRILHALATKYNLHPLAIEDVLHTRQRPKVDSYGGEDSDLQARLFIVTHAFEFHDGEMKNSQISIFLGHKTILTIQERVSEVWNPIVQRIKTKSSRLRNGDASFLMYSLLDTLIDSYFPVLEQLGERADALDDQLLDNFKRSMINDIHLLKRELLQFHRIIWPMREVVSTLLRESHECISDMTRVYLRDLYDHVIQIIDIIEIYREKASDLTETYTSSVSNHMNEIMKVLTMIGTLFIPLTFLAGVYGMNFRYFPELDQEWAYPAFWILCIIIAILMFLLFRKRRWM